MTSSRLVRDVVMSFQKKTFKTPTFTVIAWMEILFALVVEGTQAGENG